jgi:hypothetical protein
MHCVNMLSRVLEPDTHLPIIVPWLVMPPDHS